MAEEFNLHGFWYSPFTLRVVWALKLKGIPYNNIEEDRYNKSPQLLEYNPVYKKTPVLVHGGKPICESLIIVEYLDEISPHNPLLPSDSYEKAQSHFWVKYADEVFPSFSTLFRSNGGEEREKAIVNIREYLRVVEEHCFGDDKKILGGDSISIVDLAFGSLINIIAALDDIIQVKVLEPQKFPLLLSWFNNFKNIPIINENLPNHDKMVDSIKSIREKLIVS